MEPMTALRNLNFDDLLILDRPDVSKYGFADYRENGYRHPQLRGFCVECERKGCNGSTSMSSFSLKNMSHGAHSLDFLAAIANPVDVTQWHEQPVMFVFESPSKDYGIFEETKFESYMKRPTKQWSWVHEEQKEVRFPSHFKGGEYGKLFLSLIFTFRLKNAYLTNLIKCGMNSEDGLLFRPLAAFQNECVQTCMDRYLRREINALNPQVIFTFGDNVYGRLSSCGGFNVPICHLPHPARRQFKNSYFRIIYFWLVTLALKKTGVIKSAEADELAKTFVHDYTEP